MSISPGVRTSLEDDWVAIIRSRFETRLTGMGSSARTASLDQELQLLHDPMIFAIAKKCRNATVPACRLPAELLTTTFMYARDSLEQRPSRHGRQSEGDKPYELGWIHITHVCSYWREVALAAPALWCRVDFAELPPRFSMAFLKRSLSLALDLLYSGTDEIEPDEQVRGAMAVWLSKAVLQRTRRLVMLYLGHEGLGFIEKLQFRLPILEELRLKVNPEAFLIDSLEPSAFILPRPFLCGNAQQSHSSSLSRLVLEDIQLDWSSPLFTNNLTHLELIFTMGILTDVQLPTFQSFTALLSCLENLQHLQILNLFPIFDRATDLDLKRVCLPICLKELDFTVSMDDERGDTTSMNCLSLYDHLIVPATTVQSIDLTDHELTGMMSASTTAADAIITRLFSITPEDVHTTLSSLHLLPQTISARYYTLVSSPGNPPTVSTRRFTALSCEALYKHDPDVDYPTPLLRLGSNAVSLHSVESIVLSAFQSDTEHLFAISTLSSIESTSTFRGATNVHSFEMLYYNVADIFNALSKKPDGEDGFLFFPQLRTLVLGGFLMDPKYMKIQDLNNGAALIALLQARSDSGAPIQRLRVAKVLNTLDIWTLLQDSVDIEYF